MPFRWTAFLLILALLPAAAAGHAARQVEPLLTLAGQIAYTGPDGQIWILDGSTGARSPLTGGVVGGGAGAMFYAPRWSPDGLALAFRARSGEGAERVLVAHAGGALEEIDPRWNMGEFDWSPDGRALLFTDFHAAALPEAGARRGIWLYDRQSREASLLFAAGGQPALVTPSFSPDGGMVSFREFCPDCPGRFMTFDLSRRALHTWNDPSAWVGLNADWSPDGQQIVFDQWDGFNPSGGTYGLWLGARDGSQLRQIYAAPGRTAAFPRFSPDGTRVAFSQIAYNAEGRAEAADLAVLPIGGEVQVIDQGAGQVFPLNWSPDGRHLLFARQGALTGPSTLLVYDFAAGRAFPVAAGQYYAGSDWSRAPSPAFSAQQQGPQPVLSRQVSEQFVIDENVLLFRAPDGTLVLLNAVTRQTAPLTAPGAAPEFALSPLQKHILYQDAAGDGRLLALQPEPSGALFVRDYPLPAEPAYIMSHVEGGARDVGAAYAPGETIFTYMDRYERVWLVLQDGRHEQLAYAADLPGWSADGRYLAFTGLDGELYLSAQGGQPVQVAAGVERGSAVWSPSLPLLAYAVENQGVLPEQDTRRAELYDPVAGQSVLLLDSASPQSWSPDGLWLALSRVEALGASGYTWTDFVASPLEGRIVQGGTHHSADALMHGWARSAGGGYFYNGVYFPPGLDAAQPPAGLVLASAQNAPVLLLAEPPAADQPLRIQCWHQGTGERTVAADAAGTVGLGGALSAGGEWALVRLTEPQGPRVLLLRCGQGQPVDLPAAQNPGGYQFSAGGGWLGGVAAGEGGAELRLLPLDAAGAGEGWSLAAAQGSPIFWLRVPEYPLMSLSEPGQQPGGEPVPTIEPLPAVELPPLPPAAVVLEPQPEEEEGPLSALVGWVQRQNLLAVIIVVGLLLGLLLVGLLFLVSRLLLPPSRGLQPTDWHPPPVGPGPRGDTVVMPVAPSPERTSAASVAALDYAARLVREGQPEQAAARLQDLLRVEPNNPAAWYWLGAATEAQQQWRLAQRSYLRAYELGHEQAQEAYQRISADHFSGR
jgi:Tol biopolymer transport system component